MGVRFRKSVSISKGVKANVGKSGASLNVGTRGAHHTVHTSGRTTTSAGIPGTGLSYVKSSSKGTGKSGKSSSSLLSVIIGIIAVVGIFSVISKNNKTPEEQPVKAVVAEQNDEKKDENKSGENTPEPSSELLELTADPNLSDEGNTMDKVLPDAQPDEQSTPEADMEEPSTQEVDDSEIEPLETDPVEDDAAQPWKTEKQLPEENEPEPAPSPAETPTVEEVVLPMSKVNVTCYVDYDNHCSADYAILGNDEGVTVVVTVSALGLTSKDISFEYDKAYLDCKAKKPTEENGKTIFEFYLTGKKVGVSQIKITTAYELNHSGESAKYDILEVEKLNKTDGKVVYITPTGKKYHYSKKCAGDNAIKTIYYDVEGNYDPCKKCAK